MAECDFCSQSIVQFVIKVIQLIIFSLEQIENCPFLCYFFNTVFRASHMHVNVCCDKYFCVGVLWRPDYCSVFAIHAATAE